MSDPFLMKGKVYGEHKHKLVFPVIAEVKYDEIRLHVKAVMSGTGNIVVGVEFLSYAGKPLHNLGIWHNDFMNFFQNSKLRHLDMGVLVNGNFNDSYRFVRSSTGYPKEKLNKASGKVEPYLTPNMVTFYLFDIPDSEFPFADRILQREAIRQQLAEWVDAPIRTPTHFYAGSEQGLEMLFNTVREEGYEGLMVKTQSHTYHPGKRIDGWLKMKPENEVDAIITSVNQAHSMEGVPLDRAGSYNARAEDGSTVSPAGIPHELGRDMLAHPEKYVGRWVQIEYMERDRQGGYRHPSHFRFREDKE